MRIFKFLKSNQGLSIVEVLMAVGVLGIGSLALVNLTHNTAKDTRSVDSNAIKAQFYNSFKEFIYSKNGCDKIKNLIFTDQWSDLAISPNDLPKIVKENYFEVKSIKARRLTSGQSNIDPTTINSSLEIKLSLEVFKKSKKFTAPLSGTGGSGGSSGAGAGSGMASVDDEVAYFIVPALFNTSGAILKCDLDRAQDLGCKAVGGKLDSSGNCTVDTACKFRGSYVLATGYVSSEQRPNPVTGSYSCPDGISPTQTGSMQYKDQDPPGSKKGSSGVLSTGSITFWSCIECQPGATPTGGGGVVGGGVVGGGGGGGGSCTSFGSCNGCFVAGTEISMFDGSKKLIEDVRLGDELMDISGNKVIADKLVSYDYKGKIFSVNGGPYFFTPNHPFLTSDGWKSLDPEKSMKESPSVQVGLMKLGDVLVKKDGFEVIMSLDSIYSEEKVYNFSVSNSHEYIADDYAVHNLIESIKF